MAWAILNNEQRGALIELIEGESSDRVLAIVGGAILDDSLFRALDLRLRMNTSVKQKMFKIGGALGNLGPKIDIGYLLYMYEKPIRDAMYGIEKVRNFFAHNLVADLQSENPKLIKAMANLKLHEGLTHYTNPVTGKPATDDPLMKIEPIIGPRDIFIINLKICLLALRFDHRTHRHGSNLPP